MSAAQCPACSGTRCVAGPSLRFGHLPRLPIFRCLGCAHRWASTDSAVQSAIEEKYGAKYHGFRVDSFYARRVEEELEHRLLPVTLPGARLLDVGCGNGEFLLAAQKKGLDVQGIDVSSAAVSLCRDKGLLARQGDFLTAPFEGRFDVITLWDVMEHLRQPDRFALRARQLLSPDGSLVVKVPCPGALNFALLRALPARGGTLLGAPGHVQYFTEQSVASMLRNAGFAQVLWFGSRRFRQESPSRSLKQRVVRQFKGAVGRVARNRTLYFVAAQRAYGGTVVERVAPRRVQSL